MNTPEQHVHNSTRLLRMPQVLDRVGLKKTVIYERIKAGTFPKPIKLGSASAWPESEVDNWIAQQVEQQRRAA
jgi:prophage regulatory protein